MAIKLDALIGGHTDEFGGDHKQAGAAEDVNDIPGPSAGPFEIVWLEQDQ